MNSMLVLVALLFVLITIAGYQVVSMYQSSQVTLTIQQNQARLQLMAGQIRSAITIVDGKVAIPIPADLSATLPPVTAYRTTASGDLVVYCPILPDASTSATTIVNASAMPESYPVDTVEQDGLRFATAGRPGGTDDARISALGIVAYMLVPQPNARATILHCADVTVASDGSTLLVKGGSATPIYDNPVSPASTSFVLAPDGVRPSTATTADRTARSLSDVVEYIRKYDAHDLRIKLSGSETVPLADMQNLLQLSFGRSIRFEGPDGVRSVLQIDGAAASNHLVELFARGDAVFRNVALKGTSGNDVGLASVAGGRTTLDGSSAARVRSNGGAIVLVGTSRVLPDASALAAATPVVADGGNVTIGVDDSDSAPFLSAPLATAALTGQGGDVVLKTAARISTNASAALFSALVDGKIRIGTDGAQFLVDRGNGYAAEAVNQMQRVSQACADGAATCSASCPTNKRIAWGECGSANAAPLASFSVDTTGLTYVCQWSAVSLVMAPKAAVVCSNP